MIKKYCFLLLLTVLVCPLSAQVNTDSLWAVWHDAGQQDTVRLKAIQSMSWSFLRNNPDSTQALAAQALDFAQKTGHKKWVAKTLSIFGSTKHIKGDYPGALFYYQKSLAAMQELGEKKSIAALYNNIGLVYQNIGQLSKSLEYYQKDQAIQEEMGDQEGIANAYNNLGNIYSDLSNEPKAIEYFKKGLELYEHLGDKYQLAIICNNLGSVYLYEDAYELGQKYLERSLELRQQLNDEQGIAVVYINLGRLYRKQQLFAKSMSYFQQAIALQTKVKDNLGLANSYFHAGVLSMDQDNFSKAIKWCKKSRDLSHQISALLPEINACHCLYQSYKASGNSTAALLWHENYTDLRDSLKQEETKDRLQQLEFEKAILADSLVQAEEKQQIKTAYQAELNRKANMQNIILFVSVGVLLLALVFLSRMLYFQKSSEKFRDKNLLLEKQQLISEIDLLKTQVNPHFLFNSLSILSSLVRINTDLSEQFIEQLAHSYRYILEQKDQALVSLRTELAFIQSYAFLLKIRFEKKFDLQINLSEDVLDQYKIAPLTLQLLVENAVKHNRMSVAAPLIVQVSIADGFLIVKNRLQVRPQQVHSTGTGLHNIINRYALLTDQAVWAGECEDEFVVKVPLLQ